MLLICFDIFLFYIKINILVYTTKKKLWQNKFPVLLYKNVLHTQNDLLNFSRKNVLHTQNDLLNFSRKNVLPTQNDLQN